MGENKEPLYILNTDRVDEIVGQAPYWLIRWGTITFILVLLLIICLSLFVQYPETIKTSFKTAQLKENYKVKVNLASKLIFKKEIQDSRIEKGDTLFIIAFRDVLGHQAHQVYLSPVNGVIHFIKPLYTGQLILPNQFICSIASFDAFRVEINLPEAQIKKLKYGQSVILRFDSVQNELLEINNYQIVTTDILTEGSLYKVNFIINYKTKIGGRIKDRIKIGMTGTADVIIGYERLSQKIFETHYN